MERRLIFKTADEVPLGGVCVRNFWMLQAQKLGDLARRIPLELHYASLKEDIQVVYVDDPIAKCRYVIVSGKRAQKASRLIKEKIEIWGDDELFEAWGKASANSKKIAAILRIGVAAPWSFDKRYAKRLREGAGNRDRAIREASLTAIAYQDWPEMDELLRQIAEHDTDNRCRELATIMLAVRAKERAR